MNILKIKTEKRTLGSYGEKRAARYLKRHGYKILEKNYCPYDHEIDIIASKGDILAFIEVKTRTIGRENPKEPRPASSVDPEKQRGIISTAKIYIAFHPTNKKKRMDIMEVYVKHKKRRYTVAEIKHLENAYNVNTSRAYPSRR